jgi:Flp pilus assembly protein TadD
MSVIFDALRRSRKGASTSVTPPAPARPLQVPAGLGLAGSSSAPATGLRPARTRLLGIGVLLVIGLGVWAAIQVARSLVTNYAAPAPSSPFPTVRSTPEAPAPTPAPVPATVPPPPSSVASGAPMTSPSALEPSPPVPRRTRAARRPALNVAARAVQSHEPTAQSPEPKAQAPEPTTGSPIEGVNHFELAVRYHNLGNFDEALKHYLAVLAADEFNVEARNNLGLLYHRRGLTREAIEQLRRAIAITPQYVKARSNLGVVLMDAGRLAEARAELRAAMTIEPRNTDLIVNMALVEKADQHRDQAIELLVRAIGYQPTHGMAHYNVAVLYEEQSALALAYNHYTEFLKYAAPEHGELLSDVQRRLLTLKPRLASAGR